MCTLRQREKRIMPKVWQSEHVEPQQKCYERIKVKTRHREIKPPVIIK